MLSHAHLRLLTALLCAVLASGCNGGSGPATGDADAVIPTPSVVAVTPADDATDVPIDSIITATLNVRVRFPGIASFAVTCVTPCVNPTGTVTLDATDKIVAFTPTQGTVLEYLTLYTATIAGAETVGTSHPMQTPFVWTFTTQPRPTRATAASPANDPAAAPTSTDWIGSRAATLWSAAHLDDDVTAAMHPPGKPPASLSASDHASTFATARAVGPANISVLLTDPADGAVDVCPNARIDAIFDVPSGLRLDPETVTVVTFTLSQSSSRTRSAVAASVVLDSVTGDAATFLPQDDLIPGMTYTATIEGDANGVKDMAIPPNEMARGFVWTFTVGAARAACLTQPDFELPLRL